MGCHNSKDRVHPANKSTPKIPPTDWGTLDQHDLKKFEKFDLLETDTGCGRGNHWLMSLGEGLVIHVIFSTEKMRGIIRIESVEKAARHAKKLRVNNLTETAKEKGYTVLSEDKIWALIQQDFEDCDKITEEIIQGFVKFNWKKENCEHYSTKWRRFVAEVDAADLAPPYADDFSAPPPPKNSISYSFNVATPRRRRRRKITKNWRRHRRKFATGLDSFPAGGILSASMDLAYDNELFAKLVLNENMCHRKYEREEDNSSKKLPSNGKVIEVKSSKTLPSNGPLVKINPTKILPPIGKVIEVNPAKTLSPNGQVVDIKPLMVPPSSAKVVETHLSIKPIVVTSDRI
ncbi:HRAS-like suppressor 3 [Folsomia candida]|uniref:HRAS-like suppressor 3 n=1 Tax=Folsomia candida TaxID=158441 RepID=A0A226D8L7_FOLCA|nr:HRAS-like suppressor 3 [Folsomia candida]